VVIFLLGQFVHFDHREKSVRLQATMTDDKRWYLVYCKPRQEKTALLNLARQGYESYLPLMREPRRRHGRRVSVVAPMFPRYLFVHLDQTTDNWGPIRSTVGVASMVRFGQRATPIPDSLIDCLRGREDEEGIQNVMPEALKSGARVRILDGPFTGYEGIFQVRTGKERVVVLLDILGRQARASVDESALEPVARR
jgi:transcriptional antiterminator RfaH